MIQFGFQAPTKSTNTSKNVNDVMSWIWNIGANNKANDVLSKIWTIKWVNTWWSAWVQQQINQVKPVIESGKSYSIWRVNPQTPIEDDAILWASYDLTSWADPQKVFTAYPELKDKRDALMWYLYDAQNIDVKEDKLYDAYPELSRNVKTQLRSQLKTQVEKDIAQQWIETNPLSTTENIKAWALWVAQWISDVWYNLFWETANKIGDFIGSKLKDTKVAKEITDFVINNLWVSKEQLRDFQTQEELRKASWDQYSSEQNANILRTVWGRRLEQSKSWEIGKVVWKTIWETALSIWAVWLAWAWAKSILWATAKSWLWQLAKSATVWAISWLAWTEASTLASEWRLATGKELKTSALLWAAWWALFAWKITPSEKKIADTILPKMTPSVRAERAAKWLYSERWVFNKVINKLDNNEKEMLNTVKNFISPKKSIVSNINKARDVLYTETNNLQNKLSNSSYTWKTKDVINAMDKLEKPIALKWGDLEKQYNAVKQAFKKILDSSNKDAKWLLQARKEFDLLVSKEFPNLYSSDTLTPMKTAITNLRKVPNQILNDWIWDDLVKKSLRKQSLIMDAIDNMATKTEDINSSSLSRRYKNNESLIKGIWYSAGAWYGGIEIAKALSKE